MLSSNTSVETTEEKKKEKETQSSIVSKLFGYFKTAVGLSNNSKPICSGDVCYRPPAPTVTNPQNMFLQETSAPQKSSFASPSSLVEDGIEPAEEDFAKGLLKNPMALSFLLSFPEEINNEAAKKFKIKEEKVYFANQVMRTFAMWYYAGVSPEKSLIIPTANFLLKKLLSCKFDVKTSEQLSSAALFLGLTVCFGPVALAQGFAVGAAGSLTAKGCLFAVKKLADKVHVSSFSAPLTKSMQ